MLNIVIVIAFGLATYGAHAKQFRRSEIGEKCAGRLCNSNVRMACQSKIGDFAMEFRIKEDVFLTDDNMNSVRNLIKENALRANCREQFLPSEDAAYLQPPLASTRYDQ